MLKSKHTFFCKDINFGILDETESLHAIRVLRLKIGDHINIINGRGRFVIGKITSTHKKEAGFDIVEEPDIDTHPIPLHIAIAPTKSIDRFSFFVEKCTEMGIKEISPIQTSNSERTTLRIDKVEKVALSALKQSGNLYLPKLTELQSISDFLEQDFGTALKFIAHCETDAEKIKLSQSIEMNKKCVILIGPEGDFTQEEINLAKSKGFQAISLGSTRLRTETAGVLACHSVYSLY
ncbi:MAG: RsmE family RNA methyltransferase [Crocinitomicaceae bacterium]